MVSIINNFSNNKNKNGNSSIVTNINNNNRKKEEIINGISNKRNTYSFLIIVVFIISILSSHITVNAYNNIHINNNDNNMNDRSIIEKPQPQQQPILLYSKIKIINTVIESDGVDIIFNNSVSFKNLPYLSVSEYITIPIGLLHIDLYDSQSKKHLEFKRFQIENDTDYTLITVGGGSNNNNIQQQQEEEEEKEEEIKTKEISNDYNEDIEEESNYSIIILSDNFNFPTLKKRTTLRFIHCSPDIKVGVDFSLVSAATLWSNITYIGNKEHMKSKSFGSSTNFISIPKNNPYQVFIHETNREKNQFTMPENLHPAYDNPCTISFLLIGSLNNPKYPLQIFSITYPLPSTHATQFSEKQNLLSNNDQLNNHLQNNMIPSSTSPSSTTFLKFSIAVLSFVLLAMISVV